MDGHRYLIVGATGQLGQRIARALHREGAHLLLSGRDPDRLDALATQLGAARLAADLRDADAPDRLVDAAISRLGGLDGVVNAAGVVAFGPVVDLDDATLDHLVAVNLTAPVRLTRAAARRMDGGVIVTISAIVAEMPTAGMAAYSAVKSAVTAFDRAAARELRRSGLRLIDVRPPHTETGLAGRPIAGNAPALPAGRDPDVVVARIVAAMRDPHAREVSFAD